MWGTAAAPIPWTRLIHKAALHCTHSCQWYSTQAVAARGENRRSVEIKLPHLNSPTSHALFVPARSRDNSVMLAKHMAQSKPWQTLLASTHDMHAHCCSAAATTCFNRNTRTCTTQRPNILVRCQVTTAAGYASTSCMQHHSATCARDLHSLCLIAPCITTNERFGSLLGLCRA
jgi:hypothetical protein